MSAVHRGGKVEITGRQIGGIKSSFAYSSKKRIRGISWIGADTAIAELGEGRQRRFVRIDLSRSEDGGFDLTARTFAADGFLVDPLPLVDGIVVWEFDSGTRNSVHHIAIDDLVEFRKKAKVRRYSTTLGRKVAEIRGSAHRWIVNRAGIPVVAKRRDENGYTILYREGADDDLEEIWEFEDGDDDLINPVGLSADGRNLLVTSYQGEDTIGLYEFDPRNRKVIREVYRRDDADLTWIQFDPITREVLSASYQLSGATRNHYLEASRARYAPNLGVADPPISSILVVSSSADRRRFVYRTTSEVEPGAVYLRDAVRDESILVGQNGSKIDRSRLAPTEAFRVQSADGTEVEAFLTRPLEPVVEPIPLIVMPHGGPIGVRDSRQYDPMLQYFASWGFAVLQANYRGSSGYGRDFEAAGDREWAKGIEDDIDAAVDHVMALPEIDEGKICILGASYGGFSAIASVLRHPDRYRCAGTINGVSDIPLMGESSDWADSREALKFYERTLGDFETERDRLLEISPTYHLAGVEAPILVVYGDSDARVDAEHAHRMLLMLRLYEKDYEEIRVKNGRHGFSDQQWIESLPPIRRFLTEHLMPTISWEQDRRAVE